VSSQRTVPQGPKVSPARTIASLIVLAVVGVICLIEMRAGLGQYLSTKGLKAALEGEDSVAVVKKVRFSEAQALLSMSPTEDLIRETPYEKVYRYSWYSLLRPLMGEPSPQVFISVSMDEEPLATSFFTSEEEQPGAGYVYQEPPGGSAGLTPLPSLIPPEAAGEAGGPGRPMGMGGPGGMRPPGGPGGMMGPPGGGKGRRRPAVEDEEKSSPDDTKTAETEQPPTPSADPEKAADAGDAKDAETPAEKPAETPAEKPGDNPAADPSAGDAKSDEGAAAAAETRP